MSISDQVYERENSVEGCILTSESKQDMETTKRIHLPLLIEQDEDGVFIISCPSYKGCHSYGQTVEEAMSNIREVIDMCIDEEGTQELNQFVGFREIEVAI